MADLVTLTIDGIQVSVPAGTLIVDAAKKVGIRIPVFCYHPKMEPVGMCRMCLVDIGRPAVDRVTREPILEADGKPRISFGPKLETACTTPVAEGMVVVGMSEKVKAGRNAILEFLLTSHPLDCPVCDKGGECPLQNLTMGFGPGESRFEFSEKQHLGKMVPLGELIMLDRERCIQCARCVRFQDELAGEPVIGFYHRGRQLEIQTHSDPGFDSVFSGNTTDICPVGALTTMDFRFGARPWELGKAATVCTQCAVGCNLTVNYRREARADGKVVIKRIMPRQNEAVNEIWMCDKGRLAYHYTETSQRLTRPLLRKNGELSEVEWEEAIQAAAAMLNGAEGSLLTLSGGRLANEDLYNLTRLTEARNGKIRLHSPLAGGELTLDHGMAPGSNLANLGKGAVIIVVGSDLYEEGPVWYLRLRAAVKRGARLIAVHARETQMDRSATQVIRCAYSEQAGILRGMMKGTDHSLADASELVIFYGGEGLDLQQSQDLVQAAADLLQASGKAGAPNSGLVGVWNAANTQGAWEMGWNISPDLCAEIKNSNLVWVAGADPAADSRQIADALQNTRYVVVQDLFLSATAQLADLVLPVLSPFEREGSFTNAERRVQRFYQTTYPARKDIPADYALLAKIGAAAGIPLEGRAASHVFQKLAGELGVFNGLNYALLAEEVEQWPVYGRDDMYYGGTGYANKLGIGVPLPRQQAQKLSASLSSLSCTPRQGDLLLVPVTRLYDGGELMRGTGLLDQRRAKLALTIHPSEVESRGLDGHGTLRLELDGQISEVPFVSDVNAPLHTALVPRSSGLGVFTPIPAHIEVPERDAGDANTGGGERDDQ